MTYDSLARWGVNVPEILLPNKNVDLSRWAVIACDQHTANIRYWKEVESLVKDSPSTLNLIHPEIYLEDTSRKELVHKTMESYVEQRIVHSIGHRLVFIERTVHNKIRKGLLMSIDLEKYDFVEGTQLPIRSSEETILERLNSRISVKEDALLELSHVLMLINDEKNALFENIESYKQETVFDTDLMLGGGHIAGYALADSFLGHMNDTLSKLEESSSPFFIVGDGNHNLAAAKKIWENKKKSGVRSNDPARWALVELVNVYDEALTLEPIARMVLNQDENELLDFLESSAMKIDKRNLSDAAKDSIPTNESVIESMSYSAACIWNSPTATQTVWNVENALKNLSKRNPSMEIAYIHGTSEARLLAKKFNGIVILLPSIPRGQLFPAVQRFGNLPNKAFSLGQAEEKRYYLEMRALR